MISAEELRIRLDEKYVDECVNEILDKINKTLLKLKPGCDPIFSHTFTGYDDKIRNELMCRLKQLGYKTTISCYISGKWTLKLTW